MGHYFVEARKTRALDNYMPIRPRLAFPPSKFNMQNVGRLISEASRHPTNGPLPKLTQQCEIKRTILEGWGWRQFNSIQSGPIESRPGQTNLVSVAESSRTPDSIMWPELVLITPNFAKCYAMPELNHYNLPSSHSQDDGGEQEALISTVDKERSFDSLSRPLPMVNRKLTTYINIRCRNVRLKIIIGME